MPHKHRLIAALLIAVLCGSGTSKVAAQDQWERYAPATLSSVVDEHSYLIQERDDEVRLSIFATVVDYPLRATVKYAGELRPLPERSQTLVSVWIRSAQLPEESIGIFKREVLMIENGTRFWMPIQESLVEVLTARVHPGASVEVRAQYAGLVIDDKENWYFIINGFDELD